MFKLAGMIMLFLGSAGIGLLAVKHMNERVSALQSLLAALDYLECELDFSMAAMSQILFDTAKHASKPAAEFFEFCGRKMLSDAEAEFSQIWKQAVEKKLSALKQSDTEVLLSLGSVLGRFDAEHQKNSIKATCRCIEKCLDSAMEARSRHGKVCGVLGITVGFCLVILLI